MFPWGRDPGFRAREFDAPEFQRLRGVKQLGTAYLAYPGAVHTRFDHSIGTLHMTRLMIEAMRLNADLAPRSVLGVGENADHGRADSTNLLPAPQPEIRKGID